MRRISSWQGIPGRQELLSQVSNTRSQIIRSQNESLTVDLGFMLPWWKCRKHNTGSSVTRLSFVTARWDDLFLCLTLLNAVEQLSSSVPIIFLLDLLPCIGCRQAACLNVCFK